MSLPSPDEIKIYIAFGLVPNRLHPNGVDSFSTRSFRAYASNFELGDDRELFFLRKKLKLQVLNEQERFGAFHDAHDDKHYDYPKTLGKITEKFYWNGLPNDVRTWINSCKTCKKIKRERILKSIEIFKDHPYCFMPKFVKEFLNKNSDNTDDCLTAGTLPTKMIAPIDNEVATVQVKYTGGTSLASAPDAVGETKIPVSPVEVGAENNAESPKLDEKKSDSIIELRRRMATCEWEHDYISDKLTEKRKLYSMENSEHSTKKRKLGDPVQEEVVRASVSQAENERKTKPDLLKIVPVPDFIPQTEDIQFTSMLGLEWVVKAITELTVVQQNKMTVNPAASPYHCQKCRTDFTSMWSRHANGGVICQKCQDAVTKNKRMALIKWKYERILRPQVAEVPTVKKTLVSVKQANNHIRMIKPANQNLRLKIDELKKANLLTHAMMQRDARTNTQQSNSSRTAEKTLKQHSATQQNFQLRTRSSHNATNPEGTISVLLERKNRLDRFLKWKASQQKNSDSSRLVQLRKLMQIRKNQHLQRVMEQDEAAITKNSVKLTEMHRKPQQRATTSYKFQTCNGKGPPVSKPQPGRIQTENSIVNIRPLAQFHPSGSGKSVSLASAIYMSLKRQAMGSATKSSDKKIIQQRQTTSTNTTQRCSSHGSNKNVLPRSLPSNPPRSSQRISKLSTQIEGRKVASRSAAQRMLHSSVSTPQTKRQHFVKWRMIQQQQHRQLQEMQQTYLQTRREDGGRKPAEMRRILRKASSSIVAVSPKYCVPKSVPTRTLPALTNDVMVPGKRGKVRPAFQTIKLRKLAPCSGSK